MRKCKRRWIVFLLALLLAGAHALPAGAISSSHWAVDYVDLALNERFFTWETKRSHVDAEREFKRYEVPLGLARVKRADDMSITDTLTGFTDVPSDHPCSGAIEWGTRHGIIAGVGNNRFEPQSPVTREQMCAFMYRYCNHFGVSLPVVKTMPSFTDAGSITSALLPAVTALCRADVFHGYTDGSFRPKQSITIAEAANVLTLLHGIQYNSASHINVYVKDETGMDVGGAAVFFYPSNYGSMSWKPAYSTFGFARSGALSGTYGVNVMDIKTMAAVPELVSPSKRYVFVTRPTDKTNYQPVPGYSPKSKWPHSGCSDSWAFNQNSYDTYCVQNYAKSCQNFGWRYLDGAREFHQGLDISGGGVSAKNVAGQTMYVHNTRDNDKSMGNYVQLRNSSGTLYITYMHLSSRTVTTKNAAVPHGAEVGITGNTGDSRGAHLHIQVAVKEMLHPGSSADNRRYFMDPRIYIK
ncbi:MAG: peptidoglycan DD-metalloendopeptidase family protein [Clostridiales bacterium]|nr:peptidoglycan DD-metalloendopeptidase family protein [Clostridiales bacterium]